MLPNSPYLKGGAAEHAVKKKLEGQGFTHIIRSFAKSPIDLLCSSELGVIWAVQVKSAKRGYSLSEAEIQELREWSSKFNASPVLAYKKRGKWTFTRIEVKQETGSGKTQSLTMFMEETSIRTLYDNQVLSQL